MRQWIPLIGLFAILATIVFMGVFERLISSQTAFAAAIAASPLWMGFLSLFATTTIGVVVAWIGFQQWRTAHTKVALDLFENRIAVYQKVTKVMQMVMGPGRPVGNEPFKLMHEAKAEAQFLFGEEVPTYIQSLIKDMATMNYAYQQIEAHAVQAAGEVSFSDLWHSATLHFIDADQHLPALLAPYMRMDNTLPGRHAKKA